MLDNFCLLPTLALVVIVLILTVVKHLSGGSDQATPLNREGFPYRLRDDFVSAAELSLYRIVVDSAPDDTQVLAKANLGDLFFVHDGSFGTRMGWRSRINRKHVDLLVCDSRTLRPRLGIELDDRSHVREDRRQRDAFVDKVFRAAGLPLLRVPARMTYNVQELRASIEQTLAVPAESGGGTRTLAASVDTIAQVTLAAATTEGPPTCPRCNVPMLRRTATRGMYAGEVFWGCPNYPHCREIRPLEKSHSSQEFAGVTHAVDARTASRD